MKQNVDNVMGYKYFRKTLYAKDHKLCFYHSHDAAISSKAMTTACLVTEHLYSFRAVFMVRVTLFKAATFSPLQFVLEPPT